MRLKVFKLGGRWWVGQPILLGSPYRVLASFGSWREAFSYALAYRFALDNDLPTTQEW